MGLGFFVLDEFYFKNQTPEPTLEEIMAKQMAKKKKRKSVKTPASETKVSDGAVNPENPPSEVLEAKPSEEILAPEAPSESPVENINVLEKVTTIPEETVDQKLDKIAENTPTEKIEPVIEPAPVPKKEPIPESIVETVKIPEMKLAIETSPVEEVKIPSQENSIEKVSTDSGANNMASKIIETLTETPPPAYDQMGRGLVYNCKDKYWACVDRASYVICNKNLKYNESIGKSKECVVQAIYATNDDCAKIQKYNVSVSQSTDFCKN